MNQTQESAFAPYVPPGREDTLERLLRLGPLRTSELIAITGWNVSELLRTLKRMQATGRLTYVRGLEQYYVTACAPNWT